MSDGEGKPARARVTRSVDLPDPIRVARARRAPELGPRILFLSGGTALRPLSRALKQLTHNSIHLVTPFDSGGSSARLREAFGMLSVGDLRNRLIALADESVRGNPRIYELFSHRFSRDARPGELERRLGEMIAGRDPLVAAVPEPVRQIARWHLRAFASHLPPGFDLRGASVGNLILAGGYLDERDIDAVLYLFAHLVDVRGIVRPVVDADLQLAATLETGERVIGQHAITGKETDPLEAPIESLELVRSLDDPEPVHAEASAEVTELIRGADLICFPMGSFYSSVVCNLLPGGVGSAIAEAGCPKVYVPNTGCDPEQLGMEAGRAVEVLLSVLRRDAGAEVPSAHLLDLVLVDPGPGLYEREPDLDRIKQAGVEVVRTELVSERSAPDVDPERLAEILVSLG